MTDNTAAVFYLGLLMGFACCNLAWGYVVLVKTGRIQ